MSAEIVRMPIIPRRSFHDPAWIEQWEREKWDAAMKTLAPPRRTRPLIVELRPEDQTERS